MSNNYRIFETIQFKKDLKKVKMSAREKGYLRIKTKVYKQLRQIPQYGANIKKLRDWNPKTWRYRVGNYRLFYEINEKDKIIFVIAVERRDKAY